METTGTTENNVTAANDQRFENLNKDADDIIAGMFEGDDVSHEFLEQLKTVIMAYMDDDSLIRVDVDNTLEGAISCCVYSEDGVHKFLYESEEEWGGMFFGRDEVEHAFYLLNEMHVEEGEETPIH